MSIPTGTASQPTQGVKNDQTTSAAVGSATTSAVVTSIVLLVLLDAFLTMLYFIYDGQL